MGTYSCNGLIPATAHAGAADNHTVTAAGSVTKLKAATTFNLTWYLLDFPQSGHAHWDGIAEPAQSIRGGRS